MREGQPILRYKIAYSKPTKTFTAKKVKTAKSYTYLAGIIGGVLNRVSKQRKISKSRRNKRSKLKLQLFVAPRERPEREEIISKAEKFSRLDLNV